MLPNNTPKASEPRQIRSLRGECGARLSRGFETQTWSSSYYLFARPKLVVNNSLEPGGWVLEGCLRIQSPLGNFVTTVTDSIASHWKLWSRSVVVKCYSISICLFTQISWKNFVEVIKVLHSGDEEASVYQTPNYLVMLFLSFSFVRGCLHAMWLFSPECLWGTFSCTSSMLSLHPDPRKYHFIDEETGYQAAAGLGPTVLTVAEPELRSLWL